MRVAAAGLFLVTFAVTICAIRISEPSHASDPATASTGAIGEAAARVGAEKTPQAGNSVADDDFSLPEDFVAFSLQADVSDELAGRLRRGTKVDVLLIPHGQDPALPPEVVLSGLFYLPTSTIDVLDEETGAQIVTANCITLAVTRELAQKLAAAQCRGKFRVVPSK